MLFFEIVIPSLFSGLYQLACHLLVVMWFPQLKAVPRYVIGTLGVMMPPTVSVVVFDLSGWLAVLVFWLSVASSGLSVIGIRKFEHNYQKLLDDKNELERYRTLLSRIQKDAETDETS